MGQPKGITKQWYSAQELVDLRLPSLPKSKSNLIARAKKQDWLSRKRAGKGGGLEYDIHDILPKLTQDTTKTEQTHARMPEPVHKPYAKNTAKNTTGTLIKLAEALLIKSDLQKLLLSLKMRLGDNAKIQEGDTPAEDPNALLLQVSDVAQKLRDVNFLIHKTNECTPLMGDDFLDKNGIPNTLLWALCERDKLIEEHKIIGHTLECAKIDAVRHSGREIKWQRAVDVDALQKQYDTLAKHIRKLNIKIQETNWHTDVQLDSNQ